VEHAVVKAQALVEHVVVEAQAEVHLEVEEVEVLTGEGPEVLNLNGGAARLSAEGAIESRHQNYPRLPAIRVFDGPGSVSDRSR